MISEALAVLETAEQRNELSEIYERYKNRFFALAFSILKNRNDAEDAVEEAFLRIAKKPENFFALEESIKTSYLYITVRNIAVDLCKKQNRHRTSELTDPETADDGISLEDSVVGAISSDELIRFIKKLPAAQRDILALHCMVGLTMKEAAEKLNISPATAKRLLVQARQAIYQYIKERESPS